MGSSSSWSSLKTAADNEFFFWVTLGCASTSKPELLLNALERLFGPVIMTGLSSDDESEKELEWDFSDSGSKKNPFFSSLFYAFGLEFCWIRGNLISSGWSPVNTLINFKLYSRCRVCSFICGSCSRIELVVLKEFYVI